MAYTCFFVRTFVFSESHLRPFQKTSEIKCRMVSTQHFINEAQCFVLLPTESSDQCFVLLPTKSFGSMIRSSFILHVTCIGSEEETERICLPRSLSRG